MFRFMRQIRVISPKGLEGHGCEVYVADMSKNPKGARGSQFMGEGDYQRFSSKAKVMVSSEAKSWLTIREEASLLCGVVYQRQSQPIVKAKWKVKAREGVGSSKASKEDISLVVSRKKVTIGEAIEEQVLGGSAIA